MVTDIEILDRNAHNIKFVQREKTRVEHAKGMIITYKNCNFCEWKGVVVDSFPDKLRCEVCLTPWDAKEKFVKPKSSGYKPKREYE